MAENMGGPDVPEWVKEARELGYTVRVGTDPRPLRYKPDVSFHDWPEDAVEPREPFHYRLIDVFQKLRSYAAAFKDRIVHR